MAEALPTVEPSSAPQPDGVAWPTSDWPTGEASTEVRGLVDEAFADPELADTYAVVVIQHGRLLTERYGGALPSFTHAPTPVTVDTPMLSWSMAKSVLHAAVGLLVDEGRLDPDAPAAIPEWAAPTDPRRQITLRQLLQMRDGLSWVEDYEDDRISDVIYMLFGEGKEDVGTFAARHELAVPPGTRFNYSSGTSNLVARLVGDVVGRGEATRAFLSDRLFAPLGMHDATVTLDDAGTFIGSSYVYCSARSFARFATLYLRGGVWEGRALLSHSWVDDAQRPVSVDADPATFYSHHWWLDGAGTYWASGYEGQRCVVSPSRDAVLVRLGRTPDVRYPAVRAWCDTVLAALG
ncbi:MAG TPA: serine hydrolase [Acidimicrobiales bacterium]|nr:serine hydrolase [Acidimicrobiales bacterium]